MVLSLQSVAKAAGHRVGSDDSPGTARRHSAVPCDITEQSGYYHEQIQSVTGAFGTAELPHFPAFRLYVRDWTLAGAVFSPWFG